MGDEPLDLVEGVSVASYDWEDYMSSNTMASNITPSPYATNANLTFSTGTYNSNLYSVTPQSTTTLVLEGEGADIKVNEVSLMKTLGEIKERLNMLTPNVKLEAEWNQLRELGDQYRLLEAELLEKSQVWDILKKVD